MNYKNYFSILVFVFQITWAFSQNTAIKNFTLDWNDNSVVQGNGNQYITLPLVENNFFDENNIPEFNIAFNVQNGLTVQNYQIKNVKYSNLSPNSTKNINTYKIPAQLVSEFGIGKSKNKSVAKLTLTPLVKENNQIKKVISFTLEYTLQPINKTAQNKVVPTPIYSTSSVLANGTWFKFSADTTGVFKIDKSLLEKIGINTANLNPKNIRIFGNGGNMLPQLNGAFRYDDLQENAIHVIGEEDNSFDGQDYILFY